MLRLGVLPESAECMLTRKLRSKLCESKFASISAKRSSQCLIISTVAEVLKNALPMPKLAKSYLEISL